MDWSSTMLGVYTPRLMKRAAFATLSFEPSAGSRVCSRTPFVVGAAALLLVVHAGMLAYSATRHSPTVLEPAFLVAGLSHWELGRFDVFRVNPPLVRLVAALPVIAAGFTPDWTSLHDVAGGRPEFDMGADFIEANREHSIWMFTIGRWACIPFSLTGALFCFLWSRELWGHDSAGLVSLVLWCFEPNILAHAELVTTDCAATSFGLGAAYFFWRWLKKRTWQRVGLAGLLFGFAQISKLSWIILYGLWPALLPLWLWTERRNRANAGRWFGECVTSACMLASILLIGSYVTNLAYAFDGSGTRLGDFQFVSHMLGGNEPGNPGNRFAKSVLGEIPVPLPRDYVLGIDLQEKDFEDFGEPSYLKGEWKDGGWWYYYLYGLAVKTPHGSQLLLLLAVFTILTCRRGGGIYGAWRHLIVLSAPALAIFVLASSQLEFNHHVRYVLPVLGYTCVFVGVTAFWPMTGKPPETRSPLASGCRILVTAALLWTIGSTLSVYPWQLAYFNELSGGPANGSSHLLGSNLDWGQGLFELDRVLADHTEWGPVAVICPGFSEAFGLRAIAADAHDPLPSFAKYSHVAISANILTGAAQVYGSASQPPGGDAELLSRLRRQRPVHLTDYSMAVFETAPLFVERDRPDGNGIPPENAAPIGVNASLFATLPSLSDASDSHPTISTFLHVLVLDPPQRQGSRLCFSGPALDALRILTDERLASDWLRDSPFLRTRHGLRYRLDGAFLSEGAAVGESHRDQCLATFALLNLPSAYPVNLKLCSKRCTVQDLISESVANFALDQREVAWTAVAYAHYIAPARQWTDRFARTTTFSQLLARLIDDGCRGKSCGGMHVLQAAAAIVEADYRCGILDRSARVAGRNFLKNAVEEAIRSQRDDGSWDLHWCDPGATNVPQPNDARSLELKTLVTGHMLELMWRLHKPPLHAIGHATRWLIGTLQKLKRVNAPIRICPLTHALCGIELSYASRHSSYELEGIFSR